MEYYKSDENGNIIKIVDVDTICNSVKELVSRAENRAKAATEELQKLKDEKWKDEELKRMKEKLEKQSGDLWRGFPITEKEQEAIDKWKDQHYTNQHHAPDTDTRIRMQGVSGGLFTYIFLPTAIGTSGICRCNSCYNKVLRLVGQPQDYSTYHSYYEALENTVRQFDAEFEFQQIG